MARTDMLHYVELNQMEGLYAGNEFFVKVDEYKEQIKNNTFCMIAMDVEHFRVFNKLYGRELGNRLLVRMGECLITFQKRYGGVIGHLGGDNFGVLLPYEEEIMTRLQQEVNDEVKTIVNTMGFWPAFGIYKIDDASVPAVLMYDRATIALSHVMGNYQVRTCVYNQNMEEKVEEEVRLLAEVQEGLQKEEFVFYIQPQCDISTGKIVGGESLVRWKHSTKGMISPGVFVPVLERNGFIADLDKYVWERVCKWLRNWLDRGYEAVPISVNVSRIDIFSMDVPGYLQELLRKYDLPPKLLKVEVTESAYAESNDNIIRTVKQLRDSDFLVMMDDFGSGYSSLNMLKSVSVDVLKIDMRFLDIDEQEEEKGISILESVVNMARQMRMPIVVEGVETQKQESFLLKMGCRYMQGYYYYKPMPVEEFEKLIADENNLDLNGIWCRQIESLHAREFLDRNLFTDTMVNNILGAAAFYDMYENHIEVTRFNEQYYQLAGISSAGEAEYYKKVGNHVRDDDKNTLFTIFTNAYDNGNSGGQGYIHFVRTDGQVLWVYMRVFFLREVDGHKQFYASLTDMTALQEKKRSVIFAEQEVEEWTEKQKEHMEKFYGNLPCGYAVGRVNLSEEGTPKGYEILYINAELSRLCGGDLKRMQFLVERLFAHNGGNPLEKVYRAAYLGEVEEYFGYNPATNRYIQLTFSQYRYGYANCLVQDMTKFQVYQSTMKEILKSYREVYFVHLQDNYCRMVYPDENQLLERGNYVELVNRHFGTGRILRQDEENVRRFLSLENLRTVLTKKDTIEYKYRRYKEGVGEEWCLTTFQVQERDGSVPKTAIMTIRSIESLMREKEEFKHQSMAQVLANMSDGFFIYNAFGDEKILYANPSVLKIFGCDTMDEFRKLVNNSFKGMVHPDDLDRVQREIGQQVVQTDKQLDFIRYRIITKDGRVRWIDDCGHLEDAGSGDENKLFYVFISDITDTITEAEMERLLLLNELH
ncbi:MAG: EAL domain-containing protein [Lachnospiraceae bacterium]|nr:EAL domain-containing protein [Lachnospiraceae bacterium]